MAAVMQDQGDPLANPGTELTCKRCGTVWISHAKATTRCPQCRAGIRFKPVNRSTPQVSAVNSASSQVRAPPEPAPAPAPVISLHRNPAKTSVAAPKLIPAPSYDDNGYDDDDYQQSVYDQARQAQLNAVAAAIRSNTRTHPGPTGAIQMGMLPRVLVEDSDTGSIVGAVVRRVVNRRGKIIDGVQRCAYCGARPGVSTPGLFRVRSPGIEGERILCQMHSQQESVIPGCIVETL